MAKTQDGDYIIINTKDGLKKKAELVSRFNIVGLGDYIIYRLENEYYGAKYKIDGDNTTLITDLSEVEKEALNEMFSKIEAKSC